MNLFKAYMMQHLFMKKVKFLVSEPDRVGRCVYVSEGGTITRELLPMETSFLSASNLHQSWKVISKLKIYIKDKNGIIEDEPVLLISDRTYLPLDPFNRLSNKEREQLASLADIAKVRHAEARANISDEGDDPRTRLFNTGTLWAWIIAAISIVGNVIGSAIGGS